MKYLILSIIEMNILQSFLDTENILPLVFRNTAKTSSSQTQQGVICPCLLVYRKNIHNFVTKLNLQYLLSCITKRY